MFTGLLGDDGPPTRPCFYLRLRRALRYVDQAVRLLALAQEQSLSQIVTVQTLQVQSLVAMRRARDNINDLLDGIRVGSESEE